VRFWLAGKLM